MTQSSGINKDEKYKDNTGTRRYSLQAKRRCIPH